MKLEAIIEALKAVRDAGTNHRGLQTLRRQLSRSRPAADQLLSAYAAASPSFQELHGIWEVQVSAKDLKVSLELLALSTTLLSYRPSPSCSQQIRRELQHAQDSFATSIISRRLKSVYFHLSSGNRSRSNAAFALLTAISTRGGTVLRELVSTFDFSHSALPKLARPPKASAAGAAAAAGTAAAELPAADGSHVHSHWLTWNSPQLGRRPSRAAYIEWVAAMLQSADPLLLPVLLHTRVLMGGLLNHLSSDPPGVIVGVLQLLQRRVLGSSSSTAATAAASQLEVWTDSALEQLALICAAAAAALAGASANTDAAAAAGPGAGDATGTAGTASATAAATGTAIDASEHGNGSSSSSGDTDSGTSMSEDEGVADDDIMNEVGEVNAEEEEEGEQQQQQQEKKKHKPSCPDDPAANQADTAATAAAQLVAAAAAEAYKVLLLLLTSCSSGLIGPTLSSSGAAAAAVGPGTAAAPMPAVTSSSSSSVGERRVLRLLQRLHPGSSSSHAQLLQAVAAAKPYLAAELLQGLPYQLEPKPSALWLGCVAATGRLVAAATLAQSALRSRVQQAHQRLEAFAAGIETQQALRSRSSCSGSSSGSGGWWYQPVFVAPDVDESAVRSAVRTCLPPALTKGLLSRALQHQNPLVLAATLALMQHCLAAVQHMLSPVESLTAAMTAAAAAKAADGCAPRAVAGSVVPFPLPEVAEDTQMLQDAAFSLLQQHSQQVQREYQLLLSQQQGNSSMLAAAAAGAAAAAAASAGLAAVADSWGSFLDKLRGSIRMRLPDISVLVALITTLQRAAGAGAAASVGGGGGSSEQKHKKAAPSAPEAAAAAAAAVSKSQAQQQEAHQQQEQQQEPQQLSVAQSAWLLVQACSVLRLYARWLPGAVADGHVDLAKLLLQGQGQDLLTSTSAVQSAALQVLIAADEAAGAAAQPQTLQPATATAAATALWGHSSSSMTVSLLLPLMRLAAAAPSPGVRQEAVTLLTTRLAAFCSNTTEAVLWLQQLPPMWRLLEAGASSCTTSSSTKGDNDPLDGTKSSSCGQEAQEALAAAFFHAILGKASTNTAVATEQAGKAGQAAAAAAAPGSCSGAEEALSGEGNCIWTPWLSAQVAVVGFLAEAVAAVHRKPQEPWELIQTAVKPLWAAATTNDSSFCGPSSGSSSGGSGRSSNTPSLLAVSAFRRLLRLLKSTKAAAAAKAAVCGYVCGVWQLLLQQQLDQRPTLLVLQQLLKEEGLSWAVGTDAADVQDATAATAGATAARVAGSISSAGAFAVPEGPEPKQTDAKNNKKQKSSDGSVITVGQQQQQQQQQTMQLKLPCEAACIVSLWNKAAVLQTAAAGSALLHHQVPFVQLPAEGGRVAATPTAAAAASASASAHGNSSSAKHGKKRKQACLTEHDPASTVGPGVPDAVTQQQPKQHQQAHMLLSLELIYPYDNSTGQQQQQKLQHLLQEILSHDHASTAMNGLRKRSSATAAVADQGRALDAAVVPPAVLARACYAWQQLHLLLLSCPADVVTAAAAAAAVLPAPTRQPDGKHGQGTTVPAAAAAAERVREFLGMPLLLSSLSSHGLSWAHVVSAAAATGLTASAVSNLSCSALMTPSQGQKQQQQPQPQQRRQEQQQEQLSLPHLLLLAQSNWDSGGTATGTMAALPAAAPWKLLQDPCWRRQQLLLLQQLPVDTKLRLVDPICYSLARAAGAVVAGHLKRRNAELMLSFGLQALQALMLLGPGTSSSTDADGRGVTTTTTSSRSGSSSQGSVPVSCAVSQAVLQHPVLLTVFLGASTAADDASNSNSSSSRKLSVHTVLLLQWLVCRASIPAAAAVTAGSGTAVSVELEVGRSQGVPGGMTSTRLIESCLPYIIKAVALVQQELQSVVGAGPAGSHHLSSRTARMEASSCSSMGEASLAAVACLQLLPALSSLVTSNANKDSRTSNTSSSTKTLLLQAVAPLMPHLSGLATSLLQLNTGVSSQHQQQPRQKKQKAQQEDTQHQQQKQQPVAGGWASDLLLTVSQLLLLLHQQQRGGMLPVGKQDQLDSSTRATLAALMQHILNMFVLNSRPAGMDELLATALNVSWGAQAAGAASAAAEGHADAASAEAARAAAEQAGTGCPSWMLQLAAQPQVILACLQRPLSSTRVHVAAQLLASSPKDSRQSLCAAFAEGLQGCLAAAAQAAPAGSSTAAATARRETLAVLLPAAAAYLSHICCTTAAAAGSCGRVGADSLQHVDDPVVSIYRPAMLGFMQQKAKQQQGQHVSQAKAQQQQQQQESALSDSSQGLSSSAGECLHQHAVPVLQSCLKLNPLDTSTRSKLLQRLLPAKGYTAAPPLAQSSTACCHGPLPEQQLQLAAWMIQQSSLDAATSLATAAAAAATGSTASHKQQQLDQPPPQQQQEPQLLDVAAFVSCACSTLAAAYKQHPYRQQEQHQQQPPPQQQQQQEGEPVGRTPVEVFLVEQLNSWVGDFLADLPDHLRTAAAAAAPDGISGSIAPHGIAAAAAVPVTKPAFTAVVTAVRQLSIAVLKFRFGDNSSLRCLRRLLAALLPGGSSQSDPQADSQQDLLEADVTKPAGGITAADADGDADAAGTAVHGADGINDSSSSHSGSSDCGSGDDSSSEEGRGSSGSASDEEEQQLLEGPTRSTPRSNQGVDVDPWSNPTPSDADASDPSIDTSDSDNSSDSSSSGGSSSNSDGPGGTSTEAEDADMDDADTAAAAGHDVLGEACMEGGLGAQAVAVYNPAAVQTAQELLQLLMAHSRFMPCMLLPQQQQQLLPTLPLEVAAVATPLASYMPVVEAVWRCEAAPAAEANEDSSNSSNAGSRAEGDGFKYQLVLLLEALVDMTALFTSDEQPHQQQQYEAQVHAGLPASPGEGLHPQLLLSLLQLLQAAHGGSLSDCDRAVMRLLLRVDKLVPLQQQQQGSALSSSSDTDTAAAEPAAAGEVAEGQQRPAVQQQLLPWPRCLFGQAARLFYEHQQRQLEQNGSQNGSDAPAAGAAAVATEFEQQLLQELCPLDPLRCALTVVLFPDSRCLDPDNEPGDDLEQLYCCGTSASSSNSKSAGLTSAANSSNSNTCSSSGHATVCAGARADVAAAAYDPLVLLILAAEVLKRGVLNADSFAGCGLLGVVLRALSAQDDALRSLAYGCLGFLTAALSGLSKAGPDPPGLAPGLCQDQPGPSGTAPVSMQQLLRSSKRVHQLRALLSWVNAGVKEPQQQLPTASAVLAAEATLLLSAPGAPLGIMLRKLMLRQPALDTSGLPLFSRIMSAAGNAVGSKGSSKQQSGTGGSGAASLRGAAATMVERRWLLQLLWLGLRVPADGRLYRQKRVCETLMALWGTSHSHLLAATANSSRNSLAFGPIQQHHAEALAYVLDCSANSTSSCSVMSLPGLDDCIAQVLRQAVLLPGLASHLVKSSGLLPWLAAAASALGMHVPVAGATAAAAAAAAGAGVIAKRPNLWALDSLAQLLQRRVGLHTASRQQASDVFGAYRAAVVFVAAAAVRDTSASLSSQRLSSDVGLSVVHLQLLLQLLLLLCQAAPSARTRHQLQQHLVQSGLMMQLSVLVEEAASRQDGVAAAEPCSEASCWSVWKSLARQIVLSV